MSRWPASPDTAARTEARACACLLAAGGALAIVVATASARSLAPSLPPTEPATAVRAGTDGTVWLRHPAATDGAEAVTRVAVDGGRARFASLRAAVEHDPETLARLGTLAGFWAIDPAGGIWVGPTRLTGGTWHAPAAPLSQLADRVVLDPTGRAWVPFDPTGACPSPSACAPAGLLAFDANGLLVASVPQDPEPVLAARGLPMVHFPPVSDDPVAVLPHGLVRLSDGALQAFAALSPDPASGRRPAGFASAAAVDPAGRSVAFLTLERDDPAMPGGVRYDLLAHAWTGGGWDITDLSDNPLCAGHRQVPCIITAAEFDADGMLWLAAHTGGLAARGSDGTWHSHHDAGNSPLRAWVAGIAIAPDGTVWLASADGGFVLRDGRWSPWGRWHLPAVWNEDRGGAGR